MKLWMPFMGFLAALLCAWASAPDSQTRGQPKSRFLKDSTGFFDALHVDRNFNTSFSVNIPLFTVTVPGYGRGSPSPGKLNSLNIGNLALLGIVVLGGVALFYPALVSPVTYGRAFGDSAGGAENILGNSLIGLSEFVMSKVENSLDDLPSLPRLDPQECMKRMICEANHKPKKYGIMGLILQVLFPPYTETKNPSRVVSKYQLAARYGRQETAACGTQYDGCVVNFLDLFQGVTSGFLQFFS